MRLRGSKSVSVVLTGIIFSMYLFPFQLFVLPGINTKNGLAAIGLLLLAFHLAGKSQGLMNKDLFKLGLYAASVSLISLISVTLNGTTDYAYVTYIVSMCIWLSGAFVVTSSIRKTHGTISIDLICKYIIALSVFQCIVALCNDMYPPLKMFLDRYINSGQDFLDTVNRMYGIGACLDSAGIRFSCALIMVSYLIVNGKDISKVTNVLLVISYIIIVVIGNMIARTTTVGLVMSLLYLAFASGLLKFKLTNRAKQFFVWFVIIAIIIIPIGIYLYNNNITIHNNLRFAFEGVFNYFEKGKWLTASTNKLKGMYVFPESVKTWVVGDGYFSNPKDTDPYFTGEIIDGYYMGSDVGYIRFIFYFGVIGLLTFSLYICKAGAICTKYFRSQKALIMILLALNFVVWFKIATDLFFIFAILLTSKWGEENDSETSTAKE